MGSLALCCGILFFLGIESKDAGVSQIPRHRVTKMGQEVTLRCEPIPGHTALYWYRQTSMKGLQFLIYFNNQEAIDNTGMPKDRFSAEMSNKSLSTLKIQPAEPGGSAVYLCASSVGTALQSHALPVQKPQLPLLASPPAILRKGFLCSSFTTKGRVSGMT
ncbi:hypothetical protein MC885_008794, partial [Smutsia gigantea]